MFDDSKIPSNLPTDKERVHPPQADRSGEPDDIFKDVEPAKSSPAMGLSAGNPAMGYAPESVMPRSPAFPTAPPVGPVLEAEIKPPLIASKKVIIIIGVILGIFVVVGVVLSAIRFVKRSAQDQSANLTAEQAVFSDIPALPELPSANQQGETAGLSQIPNENTGTPANIETQLPLDKDGDGLTDAQELEIGTDVQNQDSDNDGLFDGEEFQTYKTDPLNPDTDNDTFLDGQEVGNNYNPNGEGRLLEIPAQ